MQQLHADLRLELGHVLADGDFDTASPMRRA
jgi:hypothetical protein